MSTWDKLLVSISNTILIPLHDIKLIAPTSIGCQQFYVFYQAGAARFRKAGCMSGMSAQRTVLVPSAGITPAAMAKAPSPGSTLDDFEERFKTVLSALPNAQVSIQDRDQDQISFVLRGLRNSVIAGSNYWEKVIVTVFVWRKFDVGYDHGDEIQEGFKNFESFKKPWLVDQSLQIRIITEGFYSGGDSTTYPKDEFFTENMEPRFQRQLTEFANKLASDFVNSSGG